MKTNSKATQPQGTGVAHIPVICDVCGNSRRTRHHPRCSKIRQQRYRRASS